MTVESKDLPVYHNHTFIYISDIGRCILLYHNMYLWFKLPLRIDCELGSNKSLCKADHKSLHGPVE